MKAESGKSQGTFQKKSDEQMYHLCPRCFPYIDLYCDICEGHGEYQIIEPPHNS